LLHDPVVLWGKSTIVVSSFDWGTAQRVYAGHADESDASHFTIHIVVDRCWLRIIDGWLQDDDTVNAAQKAT